MSAAYFFDEDTGLWLAVTDAGIYSRRDEASWAFDPRGSQRWDSLHQKIYLDRRWIEAVDQDAASALPPLPEPDAGPIVDWADNFDAELRVPAAELPALASRLGDGRDHVIYVVLHEDRWETVHGDGRFHYLHSVHFDAAAGAAQQRALEGEHSRGYLRVMSARHRDGHVSVPNFAVETFDQVRVRDILTMLERDLA